MYKIYLSLLLISSAYSQSIGFDEVLDLTLKNSKDLKNQELNINLTKQDIKNVNSISYGKLYFEEQINRTNHSGYVFNSKLSSREASFNDFGAVQYNGTSDTLNVEPNNLNYPKARNNFTTKLNYDIPIFTGFKLTNQKEILKLKKKIDEIKFKLDENELSFEVLKAYNGAVVAKEFIKATKKARESILYVVQTANAFHKEGLVTKIDVKQARVYELNINSKQIDAQNNFDLALAYLKFLTSNDNITNVNELKYINPNTLDFDLLYKSALANKSNLKIQKLNSKIKKKNIELAKSEFYPSVYSHLEYGFNDDEFTLSNDKDYYNVVIGLKYTIFDNTRNAQKQKNKIQYKQASLNYQKLKDFTKLELKKALLDLKSKEKVLKVKEEAFLLSKEIFKQSQLMYKNRLIAMTNLLKQEANMRNNQAQVILAKYESSLAKARITLISGNSITRNSTIKKAKK